MIPGLRERELIKEKKQNHQHKDNENSLNMCLCISSPREWEQKQSAKTWISERMEKNSGESSQRGPGFQAC